MNFTNQEKGLLDERLDDRGIGDRGIETGFAAGDTGGDSTNARPAPPSVFLHKYDDPFYFSEKLQENLCTAAATQGAPLYDITSKSLIIPIVIVALDGNGNPCPWAGFRAKEIDFSASLLKVAAMYAAFELRYMVNEFAYYYIGKVKTGQDLFKILKDTYNKEILDSVPQIENNSEFPIERCLPKYDQIFQWHFQENGKLDFSADFETYMQAMIVKSSNEGAAYCIDRLGYSWINGALHKSGFPDIWLTGNFVNFKNKLIMSKNDGESTNGMDAEGKSAYAMACKDMAKLFVLIYDNTLVDEESSIKMSEMLYDAAYDDDPSFMSRERQNSVLPPNFSVTHTKIGYANLGETGPIVGSEASIIKYKDANQKSWNFLIVYQNIKSSIDSLTNIVCNTIEKYVSP